MKTGENNDSYPKMKTNLVAIYHHPGLQRLFNEIGRQDHRTLVLWAIDTGREILEIYERTFPEDPRPGQALEAAEAWSRREIKMPVAKRFAKETHQAASEGKADSTVGLSERNAAAAAAHAMGQIIGVVHVGTHSTAYAAYAVQALVIRNAESDPEITLVKAVDYLSNRLAFWASSNKDKG